MKFCFQGTFFLQTCCTVTHILQKENRDTGETCSRSEWAGLIEMEKAQKQCGKDGSDLYRRNVNDSDLYKYLYQT